MATVLPDGTASLTLLGPIALAGDTLEEAQRIVHDRAAQRLRDPEISISVKDGERSRFTVLGEVATPGRYELRGNITAV